MGLELGIGLAAAVALMTNLAAPLKHRVHLGRPLATLRGPARSPWFVAGWALAALAWLAHVAALSLAPIYLVQTVLAAGAVALAILSQPLFGDPLSPGPLGIALQIAAFAMVCLSALLLPSPFDARQPARA